jgi:hypothetical protein
MIKSNLCVLVLLCYVYEAYEDVKFINLPQDTDMWWAAVKMPINVGLYNRGKCLVTG